MNTKDTVCFLLIISACSAEAVDPAGTSGPHPAEISVLIGKRPAPAGKDADLIRSAAVYIFNADSSLDNCAVSAGQSLTLKAAKGEGKHIYVVGNAPETLGAVSAERDLSRWRMSLSDNSSDSFVMTGDTVVDIAGDMAIRIPLRRLIAKIQIDTIANHSGHDLTIKAVYLANVVAGGVPYFSPDNYSPSLWADTLGLDQPEYGRLIYHQVDGVKMADGEFSTETHVFYACPNPVEDDVSGGEWSPRKTRLVVEAELAGYTYYYSITLDALKANTRYAVTHLKITRPGSSDPEIPVEPKDAALTVTPQDWEDISITETI